jgi:putative nucleotidyltransferase with HDIG domain
MLEAFNEYVSTYDLNNRDIKLKYNHSIRVMNLSKKYAKEIGFNEEDVKLATLIGLLHDIGRFEQLKVYNSYDDSKTIDHADYGVKILFDDNLIARFTNNKKDYNVIRDAIKYHNKLALPKLDTRTLKFARLIRDVDKIDIVYLMGKLNEEKIHITR